MQVRIQSEHIAPYLFCFSTFLTMLTVAMHSCESGPGTAIGALVGAIIGGVGGGVDGHALGTAAYDANYGPNSPW